jgi:uncharacterized protein YndB with AHSA1/START domain
MTTTKTVEIAVERTIPAPAHEVFDAWLDPQVPGTLWHGHHKLIFNPNVDGLWYLLTLAHRPEGTPHYGRFIAIDRPNRIQHSWMTRNTLGEETTVTVTFQKAADGTLVTIHHTGLPNEEVAKAHEGGWNFILGGFGKIFAAGPRSRM